MKLKVWLKRKFCRCKHTVHVERRFHHIGFGFCEVCGQHYFINFEEDAMIKVSKGWYEATLEDFERLYAVTGD